MSNPKIQAIFFDIDGTLLGLKSKIIPDSTIEALGLLKAKGIKIIVSTGRSYEHARFLEPLGFDGFITFNGSFCVDSDGQSFFRHTIDAGDIEILQHYLATEENFPVGVMTTEGSFISHITDDVTAIFQLLKLDVPPPQPFTKALGNEVLQLNLFVDEDKETHIINNVLRNCESSRWCPVFIDVNARGISKKIGMEQFFARYNISATATMAFGDGGNDIQMLHTAGVGVAMANAGKNVKAVADHVTGTTEEDGIWNALKAYGII
ncbi:Cof-type HAD-IIB family hydrolase [Olivibacter sp. SDN3]|uniref:Cof-type HAD-IIB family hydrolase n=1 Tax=Olivibacter sp. SDN3 TaxID=2764720 RepID=UPI0016512F96|nr:Cof-type HAD-IIB family hydrolase [Olivibacter sp. SDN3]QNL48017.1 Cof-type HAD-IIB family hydrolase [Olivibacter sp. SDN3]